MTFTLVFVIAFGIGSMLVSALGAWRAGSAPDVKYRLLWVAGSLFGFFGFATSFGIPSDLYLHFGIQIPVISVLWTSPDVGIVKVLFPIVALVALLRFRRKQ